MKSNPQISDFLPQFEMVPVLNEKGEPSGAFAKVLGFDVLDSVLKGGTENFIAFGCRLLAVAFVNAKGEPLGTAEQWAAQATFKTRDKLVDLINQVAEANGILTKQQAETLGNDSKPTGG